MRSLIVHLLPQSYHDNAFVISRALHIVNMLNFSSTFNLLEWFFKHHVKIHSINGILFSNCKLINCISLISNERFNLKRIMEINECTYYVCVNLYFKHHAL
ncbi:hypothetical protein Pint_33619 [Pistacia integerrima]|uniref:Uncharacterized protein n=1 Tax=Pistacia integerrima TaxID=434235 RepID=A0ACC0X997_9ROSI|nr:hypothetical protein Pint_33619 [Pistacia integerrima]